MIQTDSMWHNLPEVKKGDFGESLIQQHFEKLGCVCYKAVSACGHPCDMLCIDDSYKIRLVEVKTKASRNKYSDTGFDEEHYQVYKEFSKSNNTRIYIYFVDPKLKKIYGNYLDVLEEKRFVNGVEYPRLEPNRGTCFRIIYFPLEAMEDLRDLTEEELAELKTDEHVHGLYHGKT